MLGISCVAGATGNLCVRQRQFAFMCPLHHGVLTPLTCSRLFADVRTYRAAFEAAFERLPKRLSHALSLARIHVCQACEGAFEEALSCYSVNL